MFRGVQRGQKRLSGTNLSGVLGVGVCDAEHAMSASGGVAAHVQGPRPDEVSQAGFRLLQQNHSGDQSRFETRRFVPRSSSQLSQTDEVQTRAARELWSTWRIGVRTDRLLTLQIRVIREIRGSTFLVFTWASRPVLKSFSVRFRMSGMRSCAFSTGTSFMNTCPRKS